MKKIQPWKSTKYCHCHKTFHKLHGNIKLLPTNWTKNKQRPRLIRSKRQRHLQTNKRNNVILVFLKPLSTYSLQMKSRETYFPVRSTLCIPQYKIWGQIEIQIIGIPTYLICHRLSCVGAYNHTRGLTVCHRINWFWWQTVIYLKNYNNY